MRSASSILAILLFSAGMAKAQYVNGGGNLVPERDRGGDTVTVYFRDGVELLKKGECKEAERKFRKVLDKVPRNSEANYLRGIALQCLEDYDSSLTYFRRAKRDDELFYRAYEAIGVSALALGSREHAQTELDRLQAFIDVCGKKCPKDLLRSHGKLAKAIAIFDGVPVQSGGNVSGKPSGKSPGKTANETSGKTSDESSGKPPASPGDGAGDGTGRVAPHD